MITRTATPTFTHAPNRGMAAAMAYARRTAAETGGRYLPAAHGPGGAAWIENRAGTMAIHMTVEYPVDGGLAAWIAGWQYHEVREGEFDWCESTVVPFGSYPISDDGILGGSGHREVLAWLG